MAVTNSFPRAKTFKLKQRFFYAPTDKKDPRLIGTKGSVGMSNFRYDKGSLLQARGIVEAEIPSFEEGVGMSYTPLAHGNDLCIFLYLYRYSEQDVIKEKLISITSTGDGFVHDLTTGIRSQFADHITGTPVACNYNLDGEDVLLFSEGQNHMYVYDGSVFTPIQGSPAVSSICVSDERVFVTLPSKPKSVWFSDDYDPTNWNISSAEAGYINFADELGRCLKVVALAGAVYVFRDYGITKIVTAGSQENFYVTNFFRSSSRIIASSIALADNYVVFATQNKLFALSSSSIEKIGVEVDDLFRGASFDLAVSAVAKNEYCLAFRKKEKTEYSSVRNEFNDTILVLNTDTGALEILTDLDVSAMTTINTSDINEVVLCFRNGFLRGKYFVFDEGSGCMGRFPVKKSYTSAIFNAGSYSTEKFLESVELYTAEDMELVLKLNKKEYVYHLPGGDYRTVKVGKKFTEFSYTLISRTAKANILPPVFNIKIYE